MPAINTTLLANTDTPEPALIQLYLTHRGLSPGDIAAIILGCMLAVSLLLHCYILGGLGHI